MLNQHPAMQLTVQHPGNEQSPLLIVDNFIAKPELLLADAGRQCQANRQPQCARDPPP